jgi:hypothetical protein
MHSTANAARAAKASARSRLTQTQAEGPASPLAWAKASTGPIVSGEPPGPPQITCEFSVSGRSPGRRRPVADQRGAGPGRPRHVRRALVLDGLLGSSAELTREVGVLLRKERSARRLVQL